MTLSFLKRVTTPIVDFIYPPGCPLCGDDGVASEESSTHLCRDCEAQLSPQTDSFCRRCGAIRGPHLRQESRCRYCRNDRFAFSEAVSLGTYAGTLRQAILTCKQGGRQELIQALVTMLWQIHGPVFSAWQPDLVTCVPQHWRTRLKKGFNTSAELSSSLSRKLNIPCARQLLRKNRYTADQARLTQTDRRTNVKQAFRVTFPSLSRGRRILLVDDVLTTGSTAEECSRALKSAQAAEIFVAVLARGLG